MTERGCPACGCARSQPAFDAPALFVSKRVATPRKRYAYVSCDICTTVYMPQMPPIEDLRAYYESPEYHAPIPRRGPRNGRARDALFRLARPLPQHRGRHLDFGCGPGDYLWYSRARGWECTGIEYSDASAAEARSRGLRVVTEARAEESLHGERFDFVSALHALEHLPAPSETLRMLAKYLKEGATLFVEVPPLGYEFRIFGEHYAMIQAPLHVQFFSDAGMEAMAREAGLRLVRIRENVWTPVHVAWSAVNAFAAWTHLPIPRQVGIDAAAATLPLFVGPAWLLTRLGLHGVARQYYFARS